MDLEGRAEETRRSYVILVHIIKHTNSGGYHGLAGIGRAFFLEKTHARHCPSRPFYSLMADTLV